MKNKIIPYHGVITALVTPFCPDGSVDEPALEHLLERQMQNGADGILLAGTTGEASVLTRTERLRILAIARSVLGGKIPLLAGTGSNDTAHAVELSREAAAAGADALLVVTPYYNKASPAGLCAHLHAIAAASSVPLVLYDVPGRTGMHVPLSVYETLAADGTIAGVKEASGSLSAITDLLAHSGDTLAVFTGSDDLTLPALSLGADGVISVVSNLLPQEMHALWQAVQNGHLPEAQRLYFRLHPLIRALFAEVNPIPVKYACARLGWCEPVYRLPLCPPDTSTRRQIDEALEACGLL